MGWIVNILDSEDKDFFIGYLGSMISRTDFKVSVNSFALLCSKFFGRHRVVEIKVGSMEREENWRT